MIQRIQSVWLLLSSVATSLTLAIGSFEIKEDPFFTYEHSVSLVIVMLATIVSLGAIFLFRNRPLQQKITMLAVVANIALVAFLVMEFTKDKSATIEAGLFLPGAAIILLILAAAGIKKDEKLVRSSNRFR